MLSTIATHFDPLQLFVPLLILMQELWTAGLPLIVLPHSGSQIINALFTSQAEYGGSQPNVDPLKSLEIRLTK